MTLKEYVEKYNAAVIYISKIRKMDEQEILKQAWIEDIQAEMEDEALKAEGRF
jgi:hypothetical protein